MTKADTLSPDAIRTLFSKALSEMYRAEVPQYGTLIELVTEVNGQLRRGDPALDLRLTENGETERLDVERHGAIRVGTSEELGVMRRLFRVMGMEPVGYYDLSVADVPVHATAFRPIDQEALRRNPFRVFTSLLRLDLIEDDALRQEAAEILSRRTIFTPDCLALIERAERGGGLTEDDALRFISAALETFRWQKEATVSADVYRRLRSVHPLVADVVCFKGPHINHLTPRTLDIDMAQLRMPDRGITAKAIIEGPPRRKVPILLRQTSFKALEEPIAFRGADGGTVEDGMHTARFGEIEQRGVALTPKGRALYDRLLAQVRAEVTVAADGSNSEEYEGALASRFESFPDDEAALRREGLAYFRYVRTGKVEAPRGCDIEALVALGFVKAEPMTYEDFLPVSAAGIFQSNLGDAERTTIAAGANKSAFEAALGTSVRDEIALYQDAQDASIAECLRACKVVISASV
jgi:uncharacterized glyoxalase superfamily metalloenzyme YdcJ